MQILQILQKSENCAATGGGEYITNDFIDYCKINDIQFTHSAAYAHEQMDLAEIFNRTLLGKIRAMLFQAKQSNHL